jgi:hypothetical protein
MVPTGFRAIGNIRKSRRLESYTKEVRLSHLKNYFSEGKNPVQREANWLP